MGTQPYCASAEWRTLQPPHPSFALRYNIFCWLSTLVRPLSPKGALMICPRGRTAVSNLEYPKSWQPTTAKTWPRAAYIYCLHSSTRCGLIALTPSSTHEMGAGSFGFSVGDHLILLRAYFKVIRLSNQSIYNAFEIITFRALRRSFSELKEHYGFFQAVLLVFIFPDARHVLQRIERHLLRSHANETTAIEEAMALKKSLTEDCTMLAVAVSRPSILKAILLKLGSC
jgi:hypothetical protein